MMPIAPLMIEHRLIERLISVLKNHISTVPSASDLDLSLIDGAVDFLRTYADRSHHGKEEDILFVSLQQKDLTDSQKQILQELIDEHTTARDSVKALASASGQAQQGSDKSFDDIVQIVHKITRLYPAHIEKEDQRFFLPIMEYFSQTEQKEMLQQFVKFDRQNLQKKYLDWVARYEQAYPQEEIATRGSNPSDSYVCSVCGYIYSPENGDPYTDIPPGTPFAALPDGWVCPVCGAKKERFSSV